MFELLGTLERGHSAQSYKAIPWCRIHSSCGFQKLIFYGNTMQLIWRRDPRCILVSGAIWGYLTMASALGTDSIRLSGWIVVILCDLMLTRSIMRRNPPKMCIRNLEVGQILSYHIRCGWTIWNGTEDAWNVLNNCWYCFTNGLL